MVRMPTLTSVGPVAVPRARGLTAGQGGAQGGGGGVGEVHHGAAHRGHEPAHILWSEIRRF